MFCPKCQDGGGGVAVAAERKEDVKQKSVPKEFICPIRMEVMDFPVVLQDGISYEREEIEQWFRRKDTSPTTNARIDKVFVPNFNLRCLIREWKSH
jgi:hypothetical protein